VNVDPHVPRHPSHGDGHRRALSDTGEGVVENVGHHPRDPPPIPRDARIAERPAMDGRSLHSPDLRGVGELPFVLDGGSKVSISRATMAAASSIRWTSARWRALSVSLARSAWADSLMAASGLVTS
jgi:hypothetical protein